MVTLTKHVISGPDLHCAGPLVLNGFLQHLPAKYKWRSKKFLLSEAVASLEGGGPPRVSPFWGDTILWCETITPMICGKYLTFFTLFGCPHPYMWIKNPLIFRQRPFFGVCLHLLYFWYEKGCHHEKSRPGATIFSNASDLRAGPWHWAIWQIRRWLLH